MEQIDADNPLLLEWLTWWQYGYWLQADESWHPLLPLALPPDAQRYLLTQRPSLIHSTLAIPPTPLGEPQPLALTLSALSVAQRMSLLLLVAEIGGAQTALPAALKIWARRVAKGLQPERWLPDGLFHSDACCGSLQLLQALWPDLWPRLRVLFPHELSASLSADVPIIPVRHLRPLWEAALWQVQRQPAPQEVADVET